MKSELPTGAAVRQQFIDYFIQQGHTFVPSSSLVPGGDQTLLFTNAGMVQFKDVFLGTDRRPYVRAANSQKCMRVAGKHNDLEDVGQDDTHHTFFEMLGNWSFGDYYKREAIHWSWDLLTRVWGLPAEKLWATCFKDEKGEVVSDDEAADQWTKQPGFLPGHVLFFGRKENFWEMAETGPCGPCSEIHIDRGPEFCNRQHVPGHVCAVNGDCSRFLELWNLVFIQYNRLGPASLEPLASKHVDTGMGLERIVSILQDASSNYRTDLFLPMIHAVQQLAGTDNQEMNANFTPYRVVADHARAAVFLIADGVVPGNIGRNYICRMIIRRASRFGSKIGLNEPFLAEVGKKVIETYGPFYHELERNRDAILSNLTMEEERFQRTVESGLAKLENMLMRLESEHKTELNGEQAFDLYATYGLPLEITRDIVQERRFKVDETGFRNAMEAHRLASGAGEAFGPLGGEDVDTYRTLLEQLQADGKLTADGVLYNPYEWLSIEGSLLGIIHKNQVVPNAQPGDEIEVLLPSTGFYLESGGQVSDRGKIIHAEDPKWEIEVYDVRRPAAGMIVHLGRVIHGEPKVGDRIFASVDPVIRMDTMRNHTATHLLHSALQTVLGRHARQAGSLVAPDHLRFDFTHPQALTDEQLKRIEAEVNHEILGNFPLHIESKPLQEAIDQGATALFGEKYGEIVRNITIGEPQVFSNELCGGTHVEKTGDVGLFLITSEGSAAAGIRRIEAVTGKEAYRLVQTRMAVLQQSAALLDTSPEEITARLRGILDDIGELRREVTELRRIKAAAAFQDQLTDLIQVRDVQLLATAIDAADVDTLRLLSDQFRQRFPTGIAVLGSTTPDGRPVVVAAVTDDLVKRGINAVDLVKFVGSFLGGGGGGRPTLAQAGGKDASRMNEAFQQVPRWVAEKLI